MSLPSHRVCTKCNVDLPASFFRVERSVYSTWLGSRCAPCKRASSRDSGQRAARKMEEALHARGVLIISGPPVPEDRRLYNVIAGCNWRAKKRGLPGRLTLEDWLALCAFYQQRCLGCGAVDLPLTADHVVAMARGGSNDIGNIQPLCVACNYHKSFNFADYRPRTI